MGFDVLDELPSADAFTAAVRQRVARATALKIKALLLDQVRWPLCRRSALCCPFYSTRPASVPIDITTATCKEEYKLLAALASPTMVPCKE